MEMERLQKEVERLKDYFDAIDADREKAYHESRDLRRMSVQAVRDIQRGRFDDARALIESGKEISSRLKDKDVRYGFVEEAQQEYTEAAFTLAFVLRQEPMTQEELSASERGYLLGLADSVGELRRHILGLLRDDRLVEAKEYMELMDDIFGMLMKFDHTDAVIPLRRKQDMLRGIIERTRGDLTNIICQKKLESCIKENSGG